MVTKKEHKDYWCHLSQLYMTEESDDLEDPSKIIQHKLQWRSDSKHPHQCTCEFINNVHCTGLNKFIQTLDQRLLQKGSKDLTGLVAKKERLNGEPSTSTPPQGAPSWAIKGV